MITRNGSNAAVVIGPEDLAELEETISVLSDPEALAEIREADAAYDRGDTTGATLSAHRGGTHATSVSQDNDYELVLRIEHRRSAYRPR